MAGSFQKMPMGSKEEWQIESKIGYVVGRYQWSRSLGGKLLNLIESIWGSAIRLEDVQ